MEEPIFDREPHSSVLVSFKDCDAFGLLYNVRYLDYILDARAEHLLKFYEFDFNRELQKSKETWVIHGHQIAYVEPARVHEAVTIRTRILGFTSNLVHLEGMMLNRDNTRLKALQWSKLSYISLTRGNVLSHPDNIVSFLSRIQAKDDIPSPLDFEARINQLRARFQATKEK
jgi:YbgC/YbaW family acyl-CoA thioester hydrolase